MFDTIIIGAGPAGLTAALYLERALKKVLILESSTYGGQIINTIEIDNYPSQEKISGFDFATKLYNQIKDKTLIKYEKVIKINKENNIIKVKTNKEEYQTKTLIIATGLKSRKLNIENEENYLGKGISYCATCDGALFKDKIVAVVGGGNTALEEALYLSNITKKVYLIHRREEFKASINIINKLQEKENVIFLTNRTITKLIGKESLEEIELTDNNNNKEKIKIDGLFIAIGKIPESNIFKDLINIDEEGYINSGEDCKTNIDGIFVAGDIRKKNLRQLVTATSDGAVSATAAINYLNNSN